MENDSGSWWKKFKQLFHDANCKRALQFSFSSRWTIVCRFLCVLANVTILIQMDLSRFALTPKSTHWINYATHTHTNTHEHNHTQGQGHDLKTITFICISRFHFAYITYLNVLFRRRRRRYRSWCFCCRLLPSSARKNLEWIHKRNRVTVVNRLRERFIFGFRKKEAG